MEYITTPQTPLSGALLLALKLTGMGNKRSFIGVFKMTAIYS